MKGEPLTDELRTQIITAFNESGETMKNIAAQFNVSVTAVGNTISEHFAEKHKAHNQEFDEWVKRTEDEYKRLDKAISLTFDMFKRK
jgi:transposase-like protein